MDKEYVRVPQQKRSIEKKQRIIEAGYSMFIKKGYFDTNTAEIAREAGLSTGSVYAYFSDKKDIPDGLPVSVRQPIIAGNQR